MNKNLLLSMRNSPKSLLMSIPKTTFLFVLFVLFSEFAQAQDKHFTQFYAAPLTLNPALTGSMPGRYRVSGIYRDQWRGVLDDPYVTFGAAVDVNFDVGFFDSRYKDQLAVGLLFVNDKVPGIDFSTNQISLSAAFHKGLDYDKKQFLTLGVQGTMAQRNINYENLSFDDQFNNVDAFVGPTAEDLPGNNFSYADLNVGLNYRYAKKTGLVFNAGLAMHHVTKPQVSFYATSTDKDEEPLSKSSLYSKYSAQLSVQLPLADRLFLLPRVLFAIQGPHTEVNAGTNLRIKLNSFNNNALHLGTWARPVTNEDGNTSLDALVALVGIELGSVTCGLSYDMNLSSYQTYNQGQGAIEFSLTYIGSFDNEDILCPKF